MVPFLLALLPSAGVLFIFWLGIRAIVEADRRERLALARLEHQQDRAAQPRADAMSERDADESPR